MTIQSICANTVNLLKSRYSQDLICIVLFGSRARGDNREESDYDLLLVINNLPKEPIARMRNIRTTLIDSDLRVNTVVVDASEFSKDITPLSLDIFKDGICLYGKEFFEPLHTQALSAIQSAGLYRTRMGRDYYWQFEKPPQHEWELSWTGFHEFTK